MSEQQERAPSPSTRPEGRRASDWVPRHNRRASDRERPRRRASDRADEALQSELLGFASLGLSALLALALGTAHPDDLEPAGRLVTQGEAHNWIGPLGAEVADLLLSALGVIAFLLPLSLAFIGINFLRGRRILPRALDLLGYAFFILTSGFAAHLVFADHQPLGYPAGGEFGRFGAEILRALLGQVGAYISVYALLLLSFLFATRISARIGLRRLRLWLGGKRGSDLNHKLGLSRGETWEMKAEALEESVDERVPSSWDMGAIAPTEGEGPREEIEVEVEPEAPRREEALSTITHNGSTIHPGGEDVVDEAYLPSDESLAMEREEIEADTTLMPMVIEEGLGFSKPKPKAPARPEAIASLGGESLGDLSDLDLGLLDYNPPTLAHLREPAPLPDAGALEPLNKLGARLKAILATQGITGEISAARRGPILSVFEFAPGPTTPMGKLAGCGASVAKALGLPKIRVQAPIPGRQVVGFEIPNPVLAEITLKPLLETEAPCWCPLPLGVDVDGEPYVIDLFVVRHLLLGGARGEGFFDAALLNLLYRYSPSDVQIILACEGEETYEGLPHLVFPVLQGPERAAAGLRWLIQEARRRRACFAGCGVEHFIGFHEQETPPEGMPLIVLMIDDPATLRLPEMVDLAEALEGEDLGVHVIARMVQPELHALSALRALPYLGVLAFELADGASSRALLNAEGAEQLLEESDALFLEPGRHGVRRVHPPSLTPTEVQSVLTSVKAQGAPSYLDLEEVAPSRAALMDEATRLYHEALTAVQRTGRCTPEHLQSELHIDYSQAEALTHQMADEGLIERSHPNHPPRLNKAALAARLVR